MELTCTALLILAYILKVQSQIAQQNFIQRTHSQNGQMFPLLNITAFEGEEVQLRVQSPLDNQLSCVYRSPNTGVDLPIVNSEHISHWEGLKCGLRILNVKKSDEGFWRLTSIAGTDIVKGIIYVEVLTPDVYEIPDTHIFNPSDKFSPPGTKYCYVYRIGFERIQFPEHGECIIPQTHLDPEGKGDWKALAGVVGKTEELSFNINVEVIEEHLVTNITINSDYTILTCNLVNSLKTITFCRFERISDGYSLHLVEGLGNDRYSYSGNGLNNGNCALQILNPTQIDLGLWKCYIGSEDENDTFRTIGAILDISETPNDLVDLEGENVYTLTENNLNILCLSKIPIEYCWFRHPNGTAFSIPEHHIWTENSEFWYHGNGFKLGECGITLSVSNVNDSGIWSCHVGTIAISRMEAVSEISVRVTESNLVARSQFKEVHQDGSMMLECTTIPRNTPLEYCRFYLPSGQGFSINEKVTSNNAIENNYFFDPNSDLKSGHCAIIVKQSSMDMTGEWLCAAKLLGWNIESSDRIQVNVIENELSMAAIMGMAFGAIFIFGGVVLIGVYSFYKRRANNLLNAPTDTEM